MFQAFRQENSISLFKWHAVQVWWPMGVTAKAAEAGDWRDHIASSGYIQSYREV